MFPPTQLSRFRHGAQGVRPRLGIVVTDESGACAPLPIPFRDNQEARRA
jgi:hypothetical protein